MADQTDKSKIVFSPQTFERHRAAFDVVAASVVSRHPRKGITRFPGVAPGAWGLLESGGSISGCVGASLGSGSVKLCDSGGDVYPPGELVPVLNAGRPVSADGGSKILALKWVAGDWSVCGCGGTPEPTCGEQCVDFEASICEGAYYALPGTVTTSAGTHPIGKTATTAFGWTVPPVVGVYDSGFPRWELNRDTGCWELGSDTFKYFFSLRCVNGEIVVSIHVNAGQYGGAGENPEDTAVVDSCGTIWQNGTYNDANSDQYKDGLFFTKTSEVATVDSCDGDSITLSFDLFGIGSFPPQPPVSGTITLPKSSTNTDHACCEPCDIPKINLVLTVESVPGETTMVYNSTDDTWASDPVTLACGADGVRLFVNDVIFTLDAENSTCVPLHLVFTQPSGPDFYIDEP